jgi:hypothetical protein
MYSSDLGDNWNSAFLSPNRITSVAFEGTRFWAAGDNAGSISWSIDGAIWNSSIITAGGMNVTAIIPTQYGLYAAGNQGNVAYILEYSIPMDQFETYHSDTDIKINSGVEALNHVLLVGQNLIGGAGILYKMQDLGASWDTPLLSSPPSLSTEAVDINGFITGSPFIWILTVDGFVHQSDDLGTNFVPVFQHYQGGFYRSIAVKHPSTPDPLAWVAGQAGLIGCLGMGLEFINPAPNTHIMAADNIIQLKFSGVPQLPTVQKAVTIFSNIKGFVPFSADYNNGDSTIIEIFMQFGAVAGETYKIIISDELRETTTLLVSQGYSLSVDAQPFGPGDFSFNAPEAFETTGGISTNFVTGFFNNDDRFDLITFSQGNLFCYAGDGSGNFLPPENVSIGPIVNIDGNADSAFDDQLVAVDLNHDGFQDLVLYDNGVLNFITNQSTGTFDFVPSNNQGISNLVSVKPAVIDRDSTMDLVIISDQIDSRINVDETFLGDMGKSELNPGWRKVVIGDINRDGTEDFAALNTDNDIYLRRNLPWGGYDYDATVLGEFDRFRLADMDNDGYLDLLAVQGDVVEIYKHIPFWSFGLMASLIQVDTSSVTDLTVFDFTGNGQNDIVLTTKADEIKVFENQGGFTFLEREDQRRTLDINPSNLLHGDFDQDGQLDLAAFDVESGDFQVVRHGVVAWQPALDSAIVNNGQVELSWAPFPDLGALAFYRIYRDTIPGTFEFLDDVTINSYIDSTVQQGLTYYYKVEAFDTNLVASQVSNEWVVTVFQLLSGQISGVLADTVVPYLVADDIEVDQGQLLQIMPGVELLFEAGKTLTIFGRLEVLGDMDHFVKFAALDNQLPWAGIVLSGIGDQDTVLMSWFDITDADQGLRLENRPAKIRYAGISDNNIGINVRFAPNGFLDAENIIITKNQTGIQVSNTASVRLKNVTIANNINEGILASDFSAFDIKNAIIWDNNNQIVKDADIRNNAAPDMNIRYSTIDSLAGNFNLHDVSRLIPLFKPENIDSMDFVPDTLSPTIDWGDPADDFSLEPLPNGGRVNQGVYGGSPFAMTSHQPRITTNFDTLRLAARMSQTDTQQLILTNTGNRNLQISNIVSAQAEFSSDFAIAQNMLPGGTFNIDINFNPSSRSDFLDVLRIETNDPHYPPPGFAVALRGTGLNSPPVISTVSLANAIQDSAYSTSLLASDFDNDPVGFQPITKPDWMVVSTDGSISGTPRNADVGNSIPIQIEAFDGLNGYDTLATLINVLNVNDPPTIQTSSLLDATEDAPFIDTVRAVDIDNDNLVFSNVSTPAWLNVKSDGALSGIPTNDDVGSNIPVVIEVTDGNSAFDTLLTSINVINTNDAPQVTSLADTVAYALIPFDFTVPWIDIDPGDVLSFTDDTPLFDIESPSGRILFIPNLADTGQYTIEIAVNDAFVSLSDTFVLDIDLAPLNIPSDVAVTSGDQQLTLTWFNPDNIFYTGTVISLSTRAPVVHPDSGIIAYDDTTLGLKTDASATISDLEIGQSYFISLFTYFEPIPGTRIYSDPFQTVAMTQVPAVNFDYSERLRWVPPAKTLYDSITVRNDGAGTLLLKFSYVPGPVVDIWFDMDTTQQSIPPFDSLRVAFEFHPPVGLADIPHTVRVSVDDNDPLDGPSELKITMRVLFDRVAPELRMFAQPDSIYRYSAVRFAYTANDTVEQFGWKVGFPTDSLRVRYKFFKMPEAQLLAEEVGIPIQPIDFYPLPDGIYKFEMWVFDPDSNGFADMALRNMFIVSTSVIPVTQHRWYLASLPREQDVLMPSLVDDPNARVFRWENSSQRYRSFADSTLHAGQGVWILSHEPRVFNVSEFPVTQNLDSIEVAIEPGWNQIGVPAAHFIDFAKLRFRPQSSDILLSIEEAVGQKKIAPAIYWYSANLTNEGYSWIEIWKAAGQPWRGYWLLSAEPGTLVISREPIFPDPDNTVDTNPVNTDGSNALTKRSATTWEFSFTLSNDTHRDARNVIGITEREQGLPVYEPPHLDQYCSAYFPSKDGRISRELKMPFNAASDVKEWQLHVSSSSRTIHRLEWAVWDVSNGVFIYLLDNYAEEIIDISQFNSYEFKMNSENRRFNVYATLDASFEPKIIPQEFKLLQNYPNPFNPSTTIRFGVPPANDGEQMVLKIYNLLGQEVATLLDKRLSAGYYEVTWDGQSAAGKRVASGVYFYRLTGVAGQLTRKMILLK